MKNLSIITSIILIPMLGISQTKYDRFDKLIFQANELKATSQCSLAIFQYAEALNILVPQNPGVYFDLIECLISEKKFDRADKWLRRSIVEIGTSLDDIIKYERFSSIQGMPFFTLIVNDYTSLKRRYYDSIDNLDLYLEIEELINRDQFVRKIDDYISGRTSKEIEEAFKSYEKAIEANDTIAESKFREILFPKPNPDYVKLVSDLMLKIDSLNISRLMEITELYGWQKRAWILLWHQRGTYGENNEVWNFFTPIINNEISNGKISRKFWNQFDDFKFRMNKIGK